MARRTENRFGEAMAARPERCMPAFALTSARDGRIGEVCAAEGGAARPAPSRRRRIAERAQAMVEFALVLTVGLLILVVGIQYAVIGQAALALSQAAYQGARYAAVNENADQSAVASFVYSVASPTITDNSDANLSVVLNPTATPRTFQSQVSVTLTYTVGSDKLMLGNPFLGITFPTTLTATETAMQE